MEAVIVIGILGVFALIMLGVWYWSDTAQLRRSLREAPRVSIAEAPEGALVRLHGRVVDGESLQAPLTGRRCVYYVALVEERRQSGKSHHWVVRIRETRGVPFVIDDGTGRALVDPTQAQIDVEFDSNERSGTFDDPTPTERAFLDRHSVKGEGWVFNKTLRYREGVFEVGEQIAVRCLPVREPDPEGVGASRGYRDAPPTRLRVGGSADHPILLSDAREITEAPTAS